jgi:hypothetical protein
MATTECKRCGGEGMDQHKAIAGGVCFACGRLPRGAGRQTAEIIVARQERARLDLLAYYRNAKRELAAGELVEWLATSCGYGDPTTLEGIRGTLNAAAPDVAAKARAAFAAIGVAA